MKRKMFSIFADIEFVYNVSLEWHWTMSVLDSRGKKMGHKTQFARKKRQQRER